MICSKSKNDYCNQWTYHLHTFFNGRCKVFAIKVDRLEAVVQVVMPTAVP